MGITILVCTLIAIGSFFGGGEYRHWQDCKLPPKIQNITQIQNTDNVNTSIQSSSQAQITTTVITGKTNLNMVIQYNGTTNFKHNFSSRTNSRSKTNK